MYKLLGGWPLIIINSISIFAYSSLLIRKQPSIRWFDLKTFIWWSSFPPFLTWLSSHYPLSILLNYTCSIHQWEFQDPKMEVLHHIRPYFGGISPYIALNNSPYIGLIYVRYLQSFGSWNGHWYSPTWKWLLLVWPIGDSPNPKHQSNKPWGRCNTPVYTYNVGPPSDVRWFINTMNTIVIGTINHSYWSYLHQLSYRSGAPLCGLWTVMIDMGVSINMGCPKNG